MRVPAQVFEQIKARLWAQADEDDWITLNGAEKSGFYTQWVKDENVGGVLLRYGDAQEVRVYIKDTVMKPYVRERSKDAGPILRKLGMPPNDLPNEEYVKPHGRLFFDGRVVCWGQAKNWKDVIIAVYERAKRQGKRPYAAVLLNAAGVTKQTEERELIADFAKRLGLERPVEWLGD